MVPGRVEVLHSPHALSSCCKPGSVPDIDVIIGGHSHTFLYSPAAAAPDLTAGVNTTADPVIGAYPTWVNGVPVLQAFWASRWALYPSVTKATQHRPPCLDKFQAAIETSMQEVDISDVARFRKLAFQM
jgi:hypothetical protein